MEPPLLGRVTGLAQGRQKHGWRGAAGVDHRCGNDALELQDSVGQGDWLAAGAAVVVPERIARVTRRVSRAPGESLPAPEQVSRPGAVRVPGEDGTVEGHRDYHVARVAGPVHR